MELPDGLWCMNKLERLAREHFNKRCALSWAEYKTLFQERYEFEAPPDPATAGPAIAEDEDRPLNQVRGLGYTQVRAAGDRVEYIGPDSAPFEVALKSLKDLRDEMHRVTHQMALTFDNSPAAIRRSGESKAQDKASHAVVLMGLGQYVREHAYDIVTTISMGRGDDLEWTASGMNKFDSQSMGDLIIEAETLENINIPSPTFQLRHKYLIAKTKLGDEASEEDLAKIEQELEEALSGDQMPTADENQIIENVVLKEKDSDDVVLPDQGGNASKLVFSS
jgi:hypothetical protein